MEMGGSNKHDRLQWLSYNYNSEIFYSTALGHKCFKTSNRVISVKIAGNKKHTNNY